MNEKNFIRYIITYYYIYNLRNKDFNVLVNDAMEINITNYSVEINDRNPFNKTFKKLKT